MQARLLDQMDDCLLSALTPHQKSGLLLSTNTIFGTTYDKERLERGKTTANVGIVARMMGEAVVTAHRDAAESLSEQEEEGPAQ